MTEVLDPPSSRAAATNQRRSSSDAHAGAAPVPHQPSDGSGEVGYATPGPELILIVNDPHLLQSSAKPRPSTRRTAGQDAAPTFLSGLSLQHLLAEESAEAEQLFDDEIKNARVPAAEAPSGPRAGVDAGVELDGPTIDLRTVFRVVAPPERLEPLVKRLAEEESVDGVFIKPPAEAALGPRLNMMAALADAPPSLTPDFSPMQRYLDTAPGGIDAQFAWNVPGGRGKGIRIIDLEGEWKYSHESLVGKIDPKLRGGTLANSLGWRNHGTAVAGVMIGNGAGIRGICGDARLATISTFGPTPWNSAAAIRRAARKLRAGDILLLELHRPGPRFQFNSRPDQKGFIAIEWWPDDFAAIRSATRKGIIVIAAAGNGAEELDDPLYNNGPIRGRFPKWWSNPFARQTLDSGAMLVGAGAPPGNRAGADRSRLEFSNFGSNVDCQGWGLEVCTAAYGDLQGGSDANRWYTSQFSGTSSASPVVVGAACCIQGSLRRARKLPLTPLAMRALFRDTGSPQQSEPGRPASQRIGPRPDLQAMIPPVLKSQPLLPPVARAFRKKRK